ncbi:MAG: hypothetical protein CMQ45_05435 [Gammaproteobacteria bacterium]|nr:hypothetical protein [Gammaproteobacteria bacterium]
MLREDPATRTSARNLLKEVVTQITRVSVNIEVTLDLDDSQTITKMLTNPSVGDLMLAVGKPVCALFNASLIVLIRA